MRILAVSSVLLSVLLVFPAKAASPLFEVDSGPDQTTEVGEPIQLNGTIEVLGNPPIAFPRIRWSVVHGDKDTVQIANPSAESTSALFSKSGEYTLRFSVADPSGFSAKSDMNVDVHREEHRKRK